MQGDKVAFEILCTTEKLFKICTHSCSIHILQRNEIVVEHDILLVLKGHGFVSRSRGDEFMFEGGNLRLRVRRGSPEATKQENDAKGATGQYTFLHPLSSFFPFPGSCVS